jgi:hypothetical protein
MKLLFKVWYLLGQQAMSKIPYVFLAMPHEFLTEDFLKDPVMIRFIVWMLKRISPNPYLVPLKGQSKLLRLDAFEFMFGREACALTAGISLKNARTRLKQLIGLGYVKKVVNKGASTYSVYRIETSAFRQSVGQQKEQQEEQQRGQPAGHNQETQILDSKNIKETPNVIPKAIDRSPLSNKQKSDLEGLLAYCQDKNLQISERALRRWVRLYESQRIVDHLALLVDGLNGIKKPEAWMEVALKENYSALNSNTNENRAFTEDFVKRNKWNGIKITQSYCTHSLSSKDYSFRLPPESFRKMLLQCYEQYCQNGEASDDY